MFIPLKMVLIGIDPYPYENQMWILLEIVLFDCHSVIQDSQNEKKGLWMTKQVKKKLEEE
jgi:hypothetical protein